MILIRCFVWALMAFSIWISIWGIRSTREHEAWLRTLEWDWVPSAITYTRRSRMIFAGMLAWNVGIIIYTVWDMVKYGR